MANTETQFRAYRFCLDPTSTQRQTFARYSGAARWAYNSRLGTLVDGHRRYLQEVAFATYENDVDETEARALVKAGGGVATKSLTQQSGELTGLIDEDRKRYALDPESDDAWRHLINRHALKTGMRNAEQAWSNWQASHRGQRSGARVGYPRFKAKGRARDSFTLFHEAKKPTIRLATYRRLRIPNIGEVRLHDSGKKLGRAVERGDAIVKSVTVSRSAHRWYASVLVEQQQEQQDSTRRQRAAGTVGVDLGVKVTAALSTGELVPNPKVKASLAKKIAKANRALARSQQGSNNHRRLKARLARLHHHETLERSRHTHALTKRLATGWADIAVEDLNVAGMVRSARGTVETPGRNVRAKAGLSRSILDVAPGEIRRQLDYKTNWYGSRLHVVDRWAPTSKTCSSCGWVKPKLSLDERTFHCDDCGLDMDRDVNAACNIAASAAVPTEGRDVKASRRLAPDQPQGCNGAESKKHAGHSPVGGHRSGAIPNPSPNTRIRGKPAA